MTVTAIPDPLTSPREQTSAGARVRPLDPRLLRYARAARGYVAATTVIGVFTAITVIAQALLLARVIAGVAMEQQGLDDVRTPLIALAVVVAVRALLSGLGEAVGQASASRVIAQLRQAVLQRAGTLGLDLTAGEGAAALTTLTTRGLDALEPYLTKYLPQLLLTVTVTPMVLAVITWLDPLSGLSVALTLPLIPLFMALVGWSTAAMARRRLATMSRLGAQLLDLVAGLGTLRAFGRHRSQGAQIVEIGERHRRATMATLRQAFLSALVLESLTTLSVALVAVGIGLRLVFGDLDLRTGLAVLILAPEVYLPLRMVGVHYHASVDGLAAAEQAFAVLEAPTPSLAQADISSRRPAPDLSRTTIVLSGVGVRREGRAINAPAGLDLRIAPGEVVALTGPSGVGKSTAVELILGLRLPTIGLAAVLVCGDGEPAAITELDPVGWHRQIAWVPQTPALTPGTLRDNLWLDAATDREGPHDRAVTASDLDEIAELCGLSDVIAELPDGWNTVIGQGGYGLSAGQRQRLALARALAHRDAQLVILDEPSAHLDAATEQRVLAVLRRLREQGRTVLLIAHRPSLAAAADRSVTVRAEIAPAQVA